MKKYLLPCLVAFVALTLSACATECENAADKLRDECCANLSGDKKTACEEAATNLENGTDENACSEASNNVGVLCALFELADSVETP